MLQIWMTPSNISCIKVYSIWYEYRFIIILMFAFNMVCNLSCSYFQRTLSLFLMCFCRQQIVWLYIIHSGYLHLIVVVFIYLTAKWAQIMIGLTSYMLLLVFHRSHAFSSFLPPLGILKLWSWFHLFFLDDFKLCRN